MSSCSFRSLTAPLRGRKIFLTVQKGQAEVLRKEIHWLCAVYLSCLDFHSTYKIYLKQDWKGLWEPLAYCIFIESHKEKKFPVRLKRKRCDINMQFGWFKRLVKICYKTVKLYEEIITKSVWIYESKLLGKTQMLIVRIIFEESSKNSRQQPRTCLRLASVRHYSVFISNHTFSGDF